MPQKILGLAALLLAAAPAAAKPPLDLHVLHEQVILDHLGFSPGILDGRPGTQLTLALKGFQQSRRLRPTGKLDAPTMAALRPYLGLQPVRRLALTAESIAGPFVYPMPSDPAEQAKLATLGYRGPMERLAERFHTTPDVLRELNPPNTPLAPGSVLIFPNALPGSRAYPADLDPAWRQTLIDLNVDANQPQADHITVDKSDRLLRVFDTEGRLIAQFGATMGSVHDPLPIGRWKIQGESYNPAFDYNPKLFWDAGAQDRKARLPPGPNGPVGVIWIDLNKPHYGIHGTPEPELIGRSESHGCVRLTNWNAARLSLMVKPGTPAIFTR